MLRCRSLKGEKKETNWNERRTQVDRRGKRKEWEKGGAANVRTKIRKEREKERINEKGRNNMVEIRRTEEYRMRSTRVHLYRVYSTNIGIRICKRACPRNRQQMRSQRQLSSYKWFSITFSLQFSFFFRISMHVSRQ